jgi:hypothetical protein
MILQERVMSYLKQQKTAQQFCCAVLLACCLFDQGHAQPPSKLVAAEFTSNRADSELISLQLSTLAAARARIRAEDPLLKPSFIALKKRADKALEAPLRSVTNKTLTPRSGSKHDYMSMGPYWWPNDATKDGLPYVRRDGKRNPEVAGDALDSDRLVAMSNDARDLSLAYYFTGDARYAARCAAVLRTWFLDPATKMNPNLRFAQAIPGIVDGRGTGLIDSRHFWMVIDAALLIEPSGKLSANELTALRSWFGSFAKWMVESEVGLEEAASYNNHGMFYDAQLATYLRFANEPARARRVVFSAVTLRIAGQIDRNGALPHELERTKPFHYTAFALQAAMQIAHQGDALDAARGVAAGLEGELLPGKTEQCQHRQLRCPLELWSASFDGRSLKRAVESLAQAVVDPRSWTHTGSEEAKPPLFRALPVLLMAQRYAPNPRIANAINVLRSEGAVSADDVAWLMWPMPVPAEAAKK